MQGIGRDDTDLRVTVETDIATAGPDSGVQRAADAAAASARALSAAGYPPRHLSVTSTESGELVLVARLGPKPGAPVQPPPALPPAPTREASRAQTVGRLAIGLALGLVLGFLGLPRLELPAFTPPAVEPAPVPTAFDSRPQLAQDVPAATNVPAAISPAFLLPTVEPATPIPAATATPTPLFANELTRPIAGWPNDPNGTAWFGGSDYRLFARDSTHFVATGVPLPHPVQDVKLVAQFHKTGGPAGGGYGLIVRDQSPSSERDGRNQAGEYLVLEVGDNGEIGIWQRDQTRWMDVLPWQRSEAVNHDRVPNIISVTTHGETMELQVNSQIVAQVTYDQLPASGGVGIFVGGDLNEVALDWLRIDDAN